MIEIFASSTDQILDSCINTSDAKKRETSVMWLLELLKALDLPLSAADVEEKREDKIVDIKMGKWGKMMSVPAR